MTRFLISILIALVSSVGHAEPAAMPTIDQFEVDARTLCNDDADVTGFASRLQALRTQGTVTDEDLLKHAPTAFLRLAEIERVRGQFDLADRDYAIVAAVSGKTGDIARAERLTLRWDRKLREISGFSAGDKIISDAREVKAGENSAWVVALWRKPVFNSSIPLSCPEGLFALIELEPATLALYDLREDTGLARFRQAITIDIDASDISVFEALTDRRAIVGVSLIDLGNCFACESGSANFLITDKEFRQLKLPGLGRFQGPPEVSNDQVFVTTIDTRWEHFGGFAHVDGSAIHSEWRLEGDKFVEECGQKAGLIDHAPLPESGDAGYDFRAATQRFLDDSQAGRVGEAWPRYRGDLSMISRRWPDHKSQLHEIAKRLDADLRQSRKVMARHSCHLEGLRLTGDY